MTLLNRFTARTFLIVSILACLTASLIGQTSSDFSKAQAAFDTGNKILGEGDISGAIAKYTEANTILPAWHLPILNRGVAHLGLSNLTEADKDADKALALIQAGSRASSEHRAIAYQIKGMVQLRSNHNSEALAHFLKAAETDPSNAKFYNDIGNAYRMLGQNENALAAFSRSIDLDPRFSLFYVNRAYILRTLNRSEDAIKDLDEAIRLDKNSSGAYYARSLIRNHDGDYDESLADINEAIRIEPGRSVYFHLRGIVHYNLKKYDLAVKDHTLALEAEPTNLSALNSRAAANGMLGDNKAAIVDLRSAAALNPGSPLSFYNLGYFLYRDGQFAQAIESATKAIALAPNWGQPYALRGNAFIKAGNPQKGKADHTQFAKLGKGGQPGEQGQVFFDIEILAPEKTQQ